MSTGILKEITPLTQADCFTIFSRVKTEFDFPLHYHEEYEINFIQNGAGARRVVGDHMETIGELELVLVGSNLQHAWFTHQCTSPAIREITIQFHKDLLDEKFLRRNQMAFIRNLFERSARGVLFSEDTIRGIAPRIEALTQHRGFDSVLELISILHDLSTARNSRMLSDSTFNKAEITFNSRRIEKVYEFMNQHFDRSIGLGDVSEIAGMTEVSFSRFFKKRTGVTFIDSLNEIRLGHATRMLIDTTHSVSEIAYKCGFNNISNFNRIFRKKKGCTPKEFKEEYSNNKRLFI
jgi:AraC-like DNA-binding protein